MITEIRIPQVGVNDTEVVLLEWLVPDLSPVQAGQEICLIETSKITQSIAAERNGLVRRKAKPGEELPVNGIIGWITDQLEERPEESPAAERIADQIQITRKARELIARSGIPIESLPKKRGIIQEKDVRDYLQEQHGISSKPTNIPSEEPPPPVPPENINRYEPLAHAQLFIKEHMLQSLQQNAHCSIAMELDIRAINAGIAELSQQIGQIIRLNDIFVFACAQALLQHPGFNGFFWRDRHYFYNGIHIGIAMDFENNLLVPVIRDADKKPLKRIAEESASLQMDLLRKTLSPGSLEGSTFTLTNLGTLGVQSFVPIINGYQSAILGIGSAANMEKANLTLSFDHRVHNGMQAARFLKAVMDSAEKAIKT